MSEKYFIGIDGGGTKTEAVIIRGDGDVLAHVWRNQSAMVPIVGIERAVQLLSELCTALCNQSSIQLSSVKRIAVCLAGAGRKKDQGYIKNEFEKFLNAKSSPTPEIIIESDAVAALSAAFGSRGEGVILIAGTGSVALARNATGEIFRAGGWGRTMGDEGSGHWLGTKALRSYAQALDGRRNDISSQFIQSIDKRLKNFDSSGRSAISEIYSGKIIPSLFAPDIIHAAERSERFALDALEEGASELFLTITAATEKAGLALPARVAFFGGLVGDAGPPIYQSLLLSKISDPKKFFHLGSPPEPVFGAAILAQRPIEHVVASDQEW